MVRRTIPPLAVRVVHPHYQVLSSVIAAMADMSTSGDLDGPTSVLIDLPKVTSVMRNLDVGYFWMMLNCATSAAYVILAFYHDRTAPDPFNSQVLAMRKRIKSTGFSDWDTMFYNNLLSIPVLAVFSIIVEDWGSENLNRNL